MKNAHNIECTPVPNLKSINNEKETIKRKKEKKTKFNLYFQVACADKIQNYILLHFGWRRPFVFDCGCNLLPIYTTTGTIVSNCVLCTICPRFWVAMTTTTTVADMYCQNEIWNTIKQRKPYHWVKCISNWWNTPLKLVSNLFRMVRVCMSCAKIDRPNTMRK